MNIKKETLKLVLGIGYLVLIISFIRYLALSFWEVFAFFMVLILCKTLIRQIWNKTKPKIKDYIPIKSAIVLIVILYAFSFLANYGFWGFMFGCIAMGMFIIFSRWAKYIEVKRQIETMVWGKPLGEFKSGKDIPKVKFVLKK